MNSQNLTHYYKSWQSTATPEQIAFVDSVYELCERNYDAGGDMIVECYDPDDVVRDFKTLDDVRDRVGLHNEAATNARWGEDSDPEVNRPAWKDAP